MVATLTSQTADELPASLGKKESVKGGKDTSKSPFAVLMSIVSKSQKKTDEILEAKEEPQTVAVANLSPSLQNAVPSLQAKSQVAQTKLSSNISTLAAVSEFKASLTSLKEGKKEAANQPKTGANLTELITKASDKGLNISKVEWSTSAPTKEQSSPMLPLVQPKLKLDDTLIKQAATAVISQQTPSSETSPKTIKTSNELLTSLLQQPSKQQEPKTTSLKKEKTELAHTHESAPHKKEATHEKQSKEVNTLEVATSKKPDDQASLPVGIVSPSSAPQNDPTLTANATQSSPIAQTNKPTKQDVPLTKEETKTLKEATPSTSQNVTPLAQTTKEETNTSSQNHQQPKEHHTKQESSSQQAQPSSQNVSPLQTLLAVAQPVVSSTPSQSEPTSQSVPVLPTEAHVQHDNTTSVVQDKTEHAPLTNNHNTELSGKIVKARETLSTFSSNLNDALSEYKAPMTKLSLSMNPDNLGPVEVTLTQRGNAMQITVSSPSQALFFMASNAAELKNTLSQTFGDVSMTFNFSQGNSQQQEHNKKQQGWDTYQQTLQENNQADDAIVDSVEITLPRYF